jgi:SAM-dependent methyltransferase
MLKCVVCGSGDWIVFLSRDRLQSECALRERFVRERLTRPASTAELKDLTDFFHQANAEIVRCTNCSLLVRKELEKSSVETYSEDEYNFDVIDHQYPRYLEAFRCKARHYRPLLPNRARVLEIGSHYGAFLQTATEWGWDIEGVDIGKDTSRFAASKGFTVHNCELKDCGFGPASRDAIFIWNCFEQIPNPHALLDECRRILKCGGLLVLRTPNALFYSMAEDLLQTELDESGRAFLIDGMGYNNLLGFPYLYGYTANTLQRLGARHGFTRHHSLDSELLTFPLPENPEWVQKQERIVNAEVKLLARSLLSNRNGLLAGPWIEVTFAAD